jgi:hypothetical protein
MLQPSPQKESRPEILKQNRIGQLDLGIGLKEVWEISLKIGFRFPSCFFFGVVIP